MNPKEIHKRLTAIEKSTENNRQAIQEIRQELGKPSVDWCVGMWVENESIGRKGIIDAVDKERGILIHFCNLGHGIWFGEAAINREWKPIPYPYQEFLKVGDRVEWNGRKGTIIKIDGAVTPIKVLFDENIGSSSWYEIQQLTKIGEAK